MSAVINDKKIIISLAFGDSSLKDSSKSRSHLTWRVECAIWCRCSDLLYIGGKTVNVAKDVIEELGGERLDTYIVIGPMFAQNANLCISINFIGATCLHSLLNLIIDF